MNNLDTVIEHDKNIQHENSFNKQYIREWYNNLKYINIILQFFVENLKDTESNIGWCIIIISSFISFINLLAFDKNLINESFNDYYYWGKSIFVAILAAITSLLGSWVKKKNYIKRIKEIDKRIYDIERLLNKLEYQLNVINIEDKITNLDFCKTHKTLVNDLLLYSQIISPSEIKDTLYIITKYYPDIIQNIFPWYLYNELTHTWTLDINKCTQIIESYEIYNKENLYITCFKHIFCCICCYKKKNYNQLLQQSDNNNSFNHN
tara:strand:+ start:241 stop:1032 length:792 start_codon:yes stop_codon:yes gene_type:complete